MSAAHAAVRTVLADTELSDPTDIAAAAFTKLDEDDYAAILLAVLRDVARLEIGRARVHTTSARSPFVAGMRALAAQGVFSMRVFVGGEWKLYGDCDSTELRELGADSRVLAAKNVATAERHEKLAAALEEQGCATLRDLNETTLDDLLGGTL